MAETPRPSRDSFCSTTAAAIASVPFGCFSSSEDALGATAIAQVTERGTAVRLFRVHVPEATLREMRRRIKGTIWPSREA